MSEFASKKAKRVSDVPQSGIRRFFDLANSREDVISLGVGEPDFPAPWHVREACIYSLERGHTYYTSNYGLYELRELLSQSYRKRYKLDYSPEDEILITTGVSEAFDIAMRAIVDVGDEVLIPEPCYVSYAPCVRFAEGNPVYIPLSQVDFKLRYEDISSKTTEKTKALVLSYPNNPTGAIMRRKELEEVADAVVEHDLLVISDEVYSELTYTTRHTCFSELNGMKERTIILNGFSKSHSMTGLRIGYALAPYDVIEAMMTIHQYSMLCAPITAQMGAIEALKNGWESVESMKREYDRRRRLTLSRLRNMGLPCFEAEGAFYAFPSVKETGMSSKEFEERLFKDKGVIVVAGETFGPSGEGHIRCSYANSMEKLREAFERMEEFLSGI